jgi:endonuclease III
LKKEKMSRQDQAQFIFSLLQKTYPHAHCELNYSNPLELLIATILSAQCTDVRVNLVTPALFLRFPSAAHYAQAQLSEIEKLIHSTGFYRNKAKNIRDCCRQLQQEHQGEVPRTLAELHQLPGVGRKTANVVLGNAFAINEGVVVDTHVGRLARRLKWTRFTDPVKVENVLMKLIPREHWTLLSHLLIWHGRQRCKARNPDCPNCELKALCPSFSQLTREKTTAKRRKKITS